MLLRVRFAEVSRSALTELGVSLFTSPTGIKNTLGRVTHAAVFGARTSTSSSGPKDSDSSSARRSTSASGKFTFSDFLNFFVLSEKYDLGVLVQRAADPRAVPEPGRAEPRRRERQGGQLPRRRRVSDSDRAGLGGEHRRLPSQFKEFGVRLNFTPTVDGDRVHLKVRPEVSTLDFGNAVVCIGFRIPALTTRRTETELELSNGQTFAIAGLLNNTMTQTLSKVPGIGDIPILGYLFRSKAAQKNQTELVVMITPTILPQGSSG